MLWSFVYLVVRGVLGLVVLAARSGRSKDLEIMVLPHELSVSLHRTKGLQWPRVYIVGVEQGTLPDYRTETEAALSEERRACFVGVCRAETHLTLTRIEQYRGFRKPPSIFLEEMGIDPYD